MRFIVPCCQAANFRKVTHLYHHGLADDLVCPVVGRVDAEAGVVGVLSLSILRILKDGRLVESPLDHLLFCKLLLIQWPNSDIYTH